MSQDQQKIHKLVELLKTAGDRELELIYVFARSLIGK